MAVQALDVTTAGSTIKQMRLSSAGHILFSG